MATIRIKRSDTRGNPPTLLSGELAYSSLADNGFNGGDRLYIGVGNEIDGDAEQHVVIGGKVFTDMLDHVHGVLSPSSAVIVDSDSKIDQLKIGNVAIIDNTITSNIDGSNLVLSTVNTGKVSINNAYTLPNNDGITGQLLMTDGLGSVLFSTPPSSSFTIAGNNDTSDEFNTGETLSILGVSPLSVAVSDNTVTTTIATATNNDVGVAKFNSDVFSVTDGLVELKSSSIPNSKLSKPSLTIGSTNIVLGSTVTDIIGINSVSSTTFIGSLSGNASTATKLQTPQTFSLSGVVSSSGVIFDGSTNVVITSTINMSHPSGISGVLPVINGGTGSNVATGSGSVVLSNSPTLTGVPNAPTPIVGTNNNQIATTKYVQMVVDNIQTGLNVKEAVHVATTENIILSGLQTIDGITLVGGERVLVKNQFTTADNGIFIASELDWVRSSDANDATNVTHSMFVFVENGITLQNSGWVLTVDGDIVLGTTALTFVQFSGPTRIDAGDGLMKDGNVIRVVADNGVVADAYSVKLSGQALGIYNLSTSGIVVRDSNSDIVARSITGTDNRIVVVNGTGESGDPVIDIASTYAGQSSITTVGIVTSGTWNASTIDVAYGGTGHTTFSIGDLLVASDDSQLSKLSIGDSGAFLQSNGTTLIYSSVIDGGEF